MQFEIVPFPSDEGREGDRGKIERSLIWGGIFHDFVQIGRPDSARFFWLDFPGMD